jgi:hypothetical protein
MLAFKVSPWSCCPLRCWRLSPNPVNGLLWQIELLQSGEDYGRPTQDEMISRMEQRYPFPKYFDKVKVSLSLEAIKAEFASREVGKKLKLANPSRICVCNEVPVADVGLLWNMDNENFR